MPDPVEERDRRHSGDPAGSSGIAIGSAAGAIVEAERRPVRVGVQVVLHQSGMHLPRLLRALQLLDTADLALTVRVLNNSPGDGCGEVARSAAGRLEVSYLESPRGNIGFGAGHNLLAEDAGDEAFLLLVNPDALPFHDCLQRLVAAAGERPDAGLIEAAQFPLEHQKTYDGVTGVTDWCCATCLLVRVDPFRGLGGFDERLFLYCEDVDLSWRMWATGGECIYVPSAKCIHVSQEEAIGKDRSAELHHMALGDLYLRRKWFDEHDVDEHVHHLEVWFGERIAQQLRAELDAIGAPPTAPPRPPQAVLMPDHINYAPARW